jgi:hypothetical protein
MKLLLLSSLEALEHGDDKLLEDHFWQGFETGRTIFSARVGGRKLDRSVRNPFAEPQRRKKKMRVIKTPVAPAETDLTFLSGQPRKPNLEFTK